LEYLVSAWNLILEQVRAAKHILLLSDFDGTLAPIVEKPEQALMSEDIRNLIELLSNEQRFTVGIISGRTLTDLKEKVNVNGIIYAGNHGFEIEGPGMSFINPITDEIKPFFRIIRQILALTLGTIKGVFIEDKGVTLSVHYRQVDEEEVKMVEILVKKAINGPVAQGMFKITQGKKVYEVRPAVNWDKGKAIRLLMKRYGRGGRASGLLPIYLGDDLTDEDGFRMIEKYKHGITIHIGGNKNDSAARYYLNSPEEVPLFLSGLLEISQRGLLCEQWSIT
jgi:trehalose-phosphatase